MTDSVDALTDPEPLLDSSAHDVETHADSLAPEDFADAEAWESHVAVGVADDRGVLCYDDGHHGWTLPAFAVAEGEDYVAVARREFDALTGVDVAVAGVEHARRRAFTVAEDGDDRETTVWNVLVRASPVDPLADDPACHEDGAELGWFDGIPPGADGVVAADVERVVDGTSADQD
jgi:ADP-ribose pyrophosphatase YjhB (NUDIX family)